MHIHNKITDFSSNILLIVAGLSVFLLVGFILNQAAPTEVMSEVRASAELAAVPAGVNPFESGFITPASCNVWVNCQNVDGKGGVDCPSGYSTRVTTICGWVSDGKGGEEWLCSNPVQYREMYPHAEFGNACQMQCWDGSWIDNPSQSCPPQPVVASIVDDPGPNGSSNEDEGFTVTWSSNGPSSYTCSISVRDRAVGSGTWSSWVEISTARNGSTNNTTNVSADWEFNYRISCSGSTSDQDEIIHTVYDVLGFGTEPDIVTTNSPSNGVNFTDDADITLLGTASVEDVSIPGGIDWYGDLAVMWNPAGGCAGLPSNPAAGLSKPFVEAGGEWYTAGGPFRAVSVGDTRVLSGIIPSAETPTGNHCYTFVSDWDNFITESDNTNNASPWQAFAVTDGPVDGQCGPAAKNYEYSELFPNGAFCTNGQVNPASPTNPAQGGSSVWDCMGLNGGNDTACSADRGVPPPAVDLIGNNDPTDNVKIIAGDDVDLTWTISGGTPDSCTAINFLAPFPPYVSGGPVTVSPSGSTGSEFTYVLRCENGAGQISDLVRVTIVDPIPVLTSNKQFARFNEPVELTWDTNNTDETLCSLTGGGIDMDPLLGEGDPEIGSHNFNMVGTATYTLTCPNGSDIVTINLIPGIWES